MIVRSDAGRLLLITVILAPAGLAMGCPFPVLLPHHGEPASRIASLWAINGAASVAGGIVAVLASRIAGSTHALLIAARSYVVAAALDGKIELTDELDRPVPLPDSNCLLIIERR